MSELLGMDEPRKRFAAMMSGLDIHYDLGEGHPLLGRRMPDLDLVTANGPLRVFTLLHDARPVLLNLGEPGGFDITPWADRVQLIDAKYAGTWELPGSGRSLLPRRRVDSARRICGLGGRPSPGGARSTRSPPGSDRLRRRSGAENTVARLSRMHAMVLDAPGTRSGLPRRRPLTWGRDNS